MWLRYYNFIQMKINDKSMFALNMRCSFIVVLSTTMKNYVFRHNDKNINMHAVNMLCFQAKMFLRRQKSNFEKNTLITYCYP